MSPNNKKQDSKPFAASAASSPPKKPGPRPTRQTNNISRSNNPTMTIYAFANDIPIEAVTYCKDDHDDGYTHPLKQFIDHKLDVLTPAFIEAACYISTKFAVYLSLTMSKCWTALANTSATSLFDMFLVGVHQSPEQRPSKHLLHSSETAIISSILQHTSLRSMAPMWTILTHLTNFSWMTISLNSSELSSRKVTSTVIFSRITLSCPANFGPARTILNSLVRLASPSRIAEHTPR
jgi:hypothetical protein